MNMTKVFGMKPRVLICVALTAAVILLLQAPEEAIAEACGLINTTNEK